MDTSLDAIDHKLLALLQRDARLTNKELAARVGLAPSSCLARVQRLTERGALRGFHADASPAALGLAIQAVVSIQLQHHQGNATDELIAHLLTFPEVVGLYHIGGVQDLLVHVAVRDTDHLRAAVMDRIAAHPLTRHVETNIVFDHFRAPLPTAADDDVDGR